MRPAQGSLPDSVARCKPCSRFMVWTKASWERGRPARTMPGTASVISSTRIDPTAPCLSFGLAVAVPLDAVAACKVALKLSGGHKQQGCGRDARAPRAQSTTHQSAYWCSFVSIRGSSFPSVVFRVTSWITLFPFLDFSFSPSWIVPELFQIRREGADPGIE